MSNGALCAHTVPVAFLPTFWEHWYLFRIYRRQTGSMRLILERCRRPLLFTTESG
jgi:hypothetical protein